LLTVKKISTINRITTSDHKICYGLIQSSRFIHVWIPDFNRGANRDSENIALQIALNFAIFIVFQSIISGWAWFHRKIFQYVVSHTLNTCIALFFAMVHVIAKIRFMRILSPFKVRWIVQKFLTNYIFITYFPWYQCDITHVIFFDITLCILKNKIYKIGLLVVNMW
jgi:hypothetical protein